MDTPLPAVTPPEASPPRSSLHYHGSTGELFVIFLGNIVLTVLTLGIYRFWGKTRTRRYTIGQIDAFGDRFEYTGTGGELFVGFLKAMLVFVPLILLFIGAVVGITLVFGKTSKWVTVVAVLIYPIFIFLGFVAAYSGRRYRLSRIRWRGIRFGQAGKSSEYAWLMMRNAVFTVLTLGFYFPYAQMARHRYVLRNTQFGDRACEFTGEPEDMMGTFIACYLLALPTLGLSLLWYSAAEERYIFSRTRYDALSFELNLTGGALLGLMLTNVLALFFSLGLALPWIIKRNLEFFFARLALIGAESFTAIKQNPLPLQKTGEGLLDLLDADMAT